MSSPLIEPVDKSCAIDRTNALASTRASAQNNKAARRVSPHGPVCCRALLALRTGRRNTRFELAHRLLTPKSCLGNVRAPTSAAKGLFPQQVTVLGKQRSKVLPPLYDYLARVGFRGLLGRRVPKRHLTQLSGAGHSRPSPGMVQPLTSSGMVGEVMEQGRKRSGAGREAKSLSRSPYKRKAESCLTD